MLVFYLAVLPQFLGPNAGLPVLIYALSHAALSLIYLTLLVAGMSRALRLLARRRVRRALDGVTGLVQLGVGVASRPNPESATRHASCRLRDLYGYLCRPAESLAKRGRRECRVSLGDVWNPRIR